MPPGKPTKEPRQPDSIDRMIELDRKMTQYEAERAAYLAQEAAKEAEAMAYVEMVMKLRKPQKRSRKRE
jgi:hypothetical protein